ncbi:MAG: tRNA epoxyqueuosine(34) reductase QueG [Verrucomicrobia bacterium]|nr:tRNA epoxyqueuosine(34) reductase QueG [Verrucomicrobiota bacterium]
MTPGQQKAIVQKAASELGFSECRIARCEPAAHKEAFRKWLADGCHGEMDWMERTPERRENPQLVMSGAKSMVVLALNYWQGHAPPSQQQPSGAKEAKGIIARYAWGDDYHLIIEDRLADICSVLEDLGGAQQRGYVDYGPVLERDFASASGIGWNGKSTVQIHPKLGTWFFLAEVLTTLDLPVDTPSKDHCGKCTRCIDACPTNAITAPHHMDARRCISYLTIENPGPIPEEFRKAIGARIYGCDDCLDACPWNRFAQTARDAARFSRPQLQRMLLRDFLALTDNTFKTLFRHSPIKRIKRHRFLRNVCVALGNVGTAADLSALKEAANDSDPLISEHAQWAIDHIVTRLHLR